MTDPRAKPPDMSSPSPGGSGLGRSTAPRSLKATDKPANPSDYAAALACIQVIAAGSGLPREGEG